LGSSFIIFFWVPLSAVVAANCTAFAGITETIGRQDGGAKLQ